MVKVSVIVPVKNAGQELYRCVQGLLDQTLEETEILLADAGSQDESREIIADCCQQFPEQIRGLYANGETELGDARNLALRAAQGEYVAFVETGDTTEPELLEALYAAAEGADMVGADYREDEKTVRVYYPEDGVLTGEQEKAAFIAQCGVFESRMYRRAFLQSHQLDFLPGNGYSEHYFNFMTALYAGSVKKAPGIYYQHKQEKLPRNDPRMYQRLEIPTAIIEECRKRGVYDGSRELIDYKYIGMQMGNLYNICLEGFDTPSEGRIAQLCQAILRDCPNYAGGKYFKSTLWQFRYYLKKAMQSPQSAIRAYHHKSMVELRAAIHSRFSR